jgi:molybdate transport system regulatory protein
MKLSARNQLEAKVKSVRHGAVNSEVVLELRGGQQIVAVVTRSSAESLGLAPGSDAVAVVKASDVMVGTP